MKGGDEGYNRVGGRRMEGREREGEENVEILELAA